MQYGQLVLVIVGPPFLAEPPLVMFANKQGLGKIGSEQRLPTACLSIVSIIEAIERPLEKAQLSWFNKIV